MSKRSRADLLGVDPTTPSEIVAHLNTRHAYIIGKGVIVEGADDFQIISLKHFHEWYANKGTWSRTSNGADVFTPYSKTWMASPKRREAPRIVMDPRSTPKDAYNLWRGFSFEPNEEGDCSLFLAHLRDNVCNGDKQQYRWLIRWMAHLVQRPWEKPGVAVVLKGEKGVGKSIVGETLGALISRHVATVSQPRHLTGNFNAHLATAVLVLVEEAFWAGDKTGEGALKHLITGPTMALEKKGVDVIEVDSFHRYFITGNARWTVPATHDERRFAVFNVGNKRKQDGPYFEAMKNQLRGDPSQGSDSSGYGALMRYLLDVDLDRGDVRRAPNTEALAEQKLAGLRNVEAWWHDILASGDFPGDFDDYDSKDAAAWEGEAAVESDAVRDSYQRFIRQRRTHGDIVTEEEFSKRMRAMCPQLERKRRRVSPGTRRYFYKLPPLDDCRAAFESWFASPITWPTHAIEETSPGRP